MKLELNVPKYKQNCNSDDCGPTCIRMVLNAYLPPTQRKSISELPNGLKSKTEMKKIIRKEGFKIDEINWKGPKASLNFLRKSIRENKPVIVSCMSSFNCNGISYGRLGHYIVIVGVDDTNIYVRDPYPKKPNSIKIDSFLKNRQATSWGYSRWGIAVYPIE